MIHPFRQPPPTATSPGFSLVEALLAVAIFSLAVTAIMTGIMYGQESGVTAGMQSRAVMLADEGVEAVRNLRDNNFSNVTNGTWGLVQTGGRWTLSGASDTQDVFNRKVFITSLDSHTQKVASQVTWQQTLSRPGSVTSVAYLTDWRRSGSDWSSWAEPVVDQSLDLKDTGDDAKIRVQGKFAYAVRGGSKINFYILDVSNPESATVLSSLELAGSPTGISVSGDYAYVSNIETGGELQIIDVKDPAKPVLVNTYDLETALAAHDVYVVKNFAYLVLDKGENNFAVVDVEDPIKPRTIGVTSLRGVASKVYVSDSSVYVANLLDEEGLQVVDVSKPDAPTQIGRYKFEGDLQKAVSIAGYGSMVVLGRKSSNTLYIFDVSKPPDPQLLGSFVTRDGPINDVALNSDGLLAFLAIENKADNFQVVDLVDPAKPTLLEQTTAGEGSVYGVAYDGNQNRCYVSGAVDSQDFIKIRPK